MFRIPSEDDELLMNMGTISKELNDLVVIEEKKQTVKSLQACSGDYAGAAAVKNSIENTQGMAYGTTMSYRYHDLALVSHGAAPYKSASYGQIDGHLHQKTFSFHRQEPLEAGKHYTHINNVKHFDGIIGQDDTPRYLNYCPHEETKLNDNKPSFEFHYLNQKLGSLKPPTIPLLSIAANDVGSAHDKFDSWRKIISFHTKEKIRNRHDYDQIVVDIKMLGMSQNGGETNPVLRLFSCLRNLHNALSEVPPLSEQFMTYSAYEPSFAPAATITMPCTMNVQYQIKYAFRKLNNFFSSLVHIVADNRKWEQRLSLELDRYLYKLQQLMGEFEMYRRLELEHKKGQFLSEDVRLHADRLEMLLGKLTQLLREVHTRIIAYDWYVGVKYLCKKMYSSPKQMHGQMEERSKIGVINEILEMSNMAAADAVQPPKSLATQASDVKAITSTELCCKDEAVVQTDPSLAVPAATKLSSCSSKNSTTARQPVFYIG